MPSRAAKPNAKSKRRRRRGDHSRLDLRQSRRPHSGGAAGCLHTRQGNREIVRDSFDHFKRDFELLFATGSKTERS